LRSVPSAPTLATLARSVVPVWRSWTNTSLHQRPFVLSGTRLVAHDWKATKRPSALIAGNWLVLFPWVPSLATLTRSVVPAPAGGARRARTPARRPTRANHREGASERDVRASAVLMVASFGARASRCR